MAYRQSRNNGQTALDSASDSHSVRSQIVAMPNVGSLQRANRASSRTVGRHHQVRFSSDLLTNWRM
jgi:hypothetical protein